MYVGVLGFSINQGVLDEMGLPAPTGWEDLLDPRYKGLIGIANPNTSGTALTTLATQVFRKGEEKGEKIDEDAGLDYMKQLHQNIAQLYEIRCGSRHPGPDAGKLPLRSYFCTMLVYQIEEGYPVKPLAPKEGTGYEIGGLNLVKGAPHPEIAKQFMDWVVSAEAQGNPGPCRSVSITNQYQRESAGSLDPRLILSKRLIMISNGSLKMACVLPIAGRAKCLRCPGNLLTTLTPNPSPKGRGE